MFDKFMHFLTSLAVLAFVLTVLWILGCIATTLAVVSWEITKRAFTL